MNTSEKHAVVLGGSLAGLLAARVLADHFEQVTHENRFTQIRTICGPLKDSALETT